MADNREEYLSDGSGLTRVEQADHDRVIPSWLQAEAAAGDEPWEKQVKRQLEASSWAREFRNKFLEAYKVENRQMVRVWEPEKAASWLREKLVDGDTFDRNLASQVLAEAQADEEKRTEVMAMLGEDDSKPPKPAAGSPTRALSKVEVPPTAGEVLLEAAEARLKMRKAVGSYGIILTEESCQLYSKGAKLAELSTEDCGGYEVLAAEVDSMAAEAEVAAFFGLSDELDEIKSQGWLKSKGGPTYDDPAHQRADDQAGASGEFAPSAVPQSSPARVDPSSPGPASLVPGAKAPAAPQIPGQEQ